MKRLPKHLRPRWRYLAVGLETWPDATFSRGDFEQWCQSAASALLGDVGSASLDLSILHFEVAEGSGEAVVRVRRGQVDRARAVLACIGKVAARKVDDREVDDREVEDREDYNREVDGRKRDPHEVGLRVLGVAGTVRACEEKYLGRAAEETRHRSVVFENVESDAVLRHDRVDVRRDDAFAGATTIDLQ